jgi:ribosome-associated toxin RatA of RatAB toxin-antitoxin module
MKNIKKFTHVKFSPKEMFDLVANVEGYASFLPWCDHSTVLENHHNGVRAEIGLSFAGIKQSFVTENIYTPFQRIDMKLVRGPFSHLDGAWIFTDIPNKTDQCIVELHLNYEVKNFILSKIIGPSFDKIASNLSDAFIQQATKRYLRDR